MMGRTMSLSNNCNAAPNFVLYGIGNKIMKDIKKMNHNEENAGDFYC